MADQHEKTSSDIGSDNGPLYSSYGQAARQDRFSTTPRMFNDGEDSPWRQNANMPPFESDASKASRWFTVTRLLSVLVIVLIVLFAAGSIYGVEQVHNRDATILDGKATINSLSHSNTELQTQVSGLVTERDNLATHSDALQAQLADITSDRDNLVSQRDKLTNETNGLKAQNTDLQKKLDDTQASLDDTSRKLNQAQSEQSRQQTRADNAEQLSSALGDVITLDNQIHDQYLIFLDRLDAVNDAAKANNYYAYSQAYDLAMQTANTLDSLFARRNAALAELQ